MERKCERRTGKPLAACSRVWIYRTRTCTSAAKSQSPKVVFSRLLLLFLLPPLLYCSLATSSAVGIVPVKCQMEIERTLYNVYLIRLFAIALCERNMRRLLKNWTRTWKMEKKTKRGARCMRHRESNGKELQITKKQKMKKGIKRTKSFANPLAAKTHKWQRRPYFSFSSHWLLPCVYVDVHDSAKATIQMHIEPLYQFLLLSLFRSLVHVLDISGFVQFIALSLASSNRMCWCKRESVYLCVTVSVCESVCVVENMSSTFRKNWKEKKTLWKKRANEGKLGNYRQRAREAKPCHWRTLNPASSWITTFDRFKSLFSAISVSVLRAISVASKWHFPVFSWKSNDQIDEIQYNGMVIQWKAN